jgi:2-methylisocitrate lyase-like PEP mutase family enzyme
MMSDTTFRDLHVPGQPFVIANVWDVGSAQMLAAKGAKALATSSAALAFIIGNRDMGHISRDDALTHAQDICAATNLPVQGDFENGFGDDPETCAETVRLAAEVGLAGICIEDTALPAQTPYEFDLAVERMRAASAAARALPNDFFFVARADGCLTGQYDLDEAIRRIQAFEDAGADGLYVPMPPQLQDLETLCRSVSKPVNALAAGRFTSLTLAEYAAMGVARVSLGSALARATHRLMADTADAMLEQGDFTALGKSISGGAVDAMLAQGARN